MSAGQFNFSIEKGTSPPIVITYKDSLGNPIDLTGYTAKMQVRPVAGSSTVILDLTSLSVPGPATLILGGTAGTVSFAISPATTRAITAMTGVYDLELTPPSGLTFRLLQGAISFIPEVTQS